jgi:hypothetical protein
MIFKIVAEEPWIYYGDLKGRSVSVWLINATNVHEAVRIIESNFISEDGEAVEASEHFLNTANKVINISTEHYKGEKMSRDYFDKDQRPRWYRDFASNKPKEL